MPRRSSRVKVGPRDDLLFHSSPGRPASRRGDSPAEFAEKKDLASDSDRSDVIDPNSSPSLRASPIFVFSAVSAPLREHCLLFPNPLPNLDYPGFWIGHSSDSVGSTWIQCDPVRLSRILASVAGQTGRMEPIRKPRERLGIGTWNSFRRNPPTGRKPKFLPPRSQPFRFSVISKSSPPIPQPGLPWTTLDFWAFATLIWADPLGLGAIQCD